MRRPAPAGMDDEAILREIVANGEEMVRIERGPPPDISGWDKGVWAIGAGLTILGMVATGPLGLPGLLIGLGGLSLIGVDMAKKAAETRGDFEAAARLDFLRMRNAVLKNTLQRRHPGVRID